MSRGNKNLNVEGTSIPARIEHFRKLRKMAQADLADAAGLNYRTIHDIEMGRRKRVLERTIMLIAAALDVTYEDLTGPGDETGDHNGSPLFPAVRWLLAGAVLAALVAGFFIARHYAIRNGHMVHENNRIEYRTAWVGIKVWDRQWQSKVEFCRPSPWSDEIVLVGLLGNYTDGGRLIAFDRFSGDALWEARPDVEATKRAFGSEVVDAANFHCNAFIPVDIDGDGTPELAVNFPHALWYPASLCLIDRHGNRLRHYANCGHLYGFAAEDLDGDGKEELLVSGTNNAKAYQGGTLILLDEDHFAGASIDSLCHPESSEPDSALVRLVFPQFDRTVMEQMKTLRLDASTIRTRIDDAGDTTVNLDVGLNDSGYNLVVKLDGQLRPQGISISDHFLYTINSTWPDSLILGNGPTDPQWRARWLATHRRFEAGHWPPPVVARAGGS